MASWLWLNVSLMAVFFLATAGIPLWLVLERPERAPGEHQPSAAAKVRASADEPAPPKTPSTRAAVRALS